MGNRPCHSGICGVSRQARVAADDMRRFSTPMVRIPSEVLPETTRGSGWIDPVALRPLDKGEKYVHAGTVSVEPKQDRVQQLIRACNVTHEADLEESNEMKRLFKGITDDIDPSEDAPLPAGAGEGEVDASKVTPMKRDLILASSSPRRQEMLRVLGIAFEIHPAEIEEIPFHGEEPAAFAARMARQKAQAVARVHPDAVVIGADTVVVLEGRILGKPVDAADAVRMLKALRGQEHKVMTGFSVIVREAGIERNRVITSTVFVRRLTDREIEGYVATGEPLDKAGAYAIQGIGAFLVEGIVGSYTNIVGLPLSELLDELEAIGAVRLFDQEG